MTLTETQRLALAALGDRKNRTRYEIRRAANLTALTGSTLLALHRAGLIEEHDRLDGPETYTITADGLNALEDTDAT